MAKTDNLVRGDGATDLHPNSATPEAESVEFRSAHGAPSGVKSARRAGIGPDLPEKLTPQLKARLLYEYCLASDKKIGESVHNLYVIAQHYAGNDPTELENPEIINGIPPFFKALTTREKSDYCYNQVTESLSLEALPVTVESLRATRRADPTDPRSSIAGQFVWRVTCYVTYTLMVLLTLFLAYQLWNVVMPERWRVAEQPFRVEWFVWIAFGCVGALVHLLNHALTTTRLQVFEVSEERKIWPRLLLGGMFGFILPWILVSTTKFGVDDNLALATVAAFFAGYSVRFSIGLLERLLSALFPEIKPRA